MKSLYDTSYAELKSPIPQINVQYLTKLNDLKYTKLDKKRCSHMSVEVKLEIVTDRPTDQPTD